MSNIKELNDESFNSEVVTQKGIVLIDFWAPWCGPCKMLSPIVERISQKYIDRIKVFKINTDEAPAITQQYHIRSIPTLLFFKDGEVIDTIVGAVPEDEIKEKLDKILE